MVALARDLKSARMGHSVVHSLTRFDIRMIFVSPAQLKMPARITEDLVVWCVKVTESEDLASAVREHDVTYITRIQKEQFEDPGEFERLRRVYVLDWAMVEDANEGTHSWRYGRGDKPRGRLGGWGSLFRGCHGPRPRPSPKWTPVDTALDLEKQASAAAGSGQGKDSPE